ncbi:MAG: macB 23 [Chitinophagaceae bacterium]|nr:macB 23 [Chitinophagaceae bacterium]
MITHLFKLIWNKKKQNFLLMLEMLISFIIMFAVFTLLVYYYQNYRHPRGFDYENVWSIKYNDPDDMKNADSISAFNASIKQIIKSMPQVEEVSLCNINVPFGDAGIGTSVSYNKTSVITEIYRVDDDYKKVLNLQLTEGRWFSKEDDVTKEKSVVINEALKNA